MDSASFRINVAACRSDGPLFRINSAPFPLHDLVFRRHDVSPPRSMTGRSRSRVVCSASIARRSASGVICSASIASRSASIASRSASIAARSHRRAVCAGEMDKGHGTMIARAGCRDGFARHLDVRAESVSRRVAARDTFFASCDLCRGDLAKRTRACVVRAGSRVAFSMPEIFVLATRTAAPGPAWTELGPASLASAPAPVRCDTASFVPVTTMFVPLTSASRSMAASCRAASAMFLSRPESRASGPASRASITRMFLSATALFLSVIGTCLRKAATLFSGLRRVHAHIGRTFRRARCIVAKQPIRTTASRDTTAISRSGNALPADCARVTSSQWTRERRGSLEVEDAHKARVGIRSTLIRHLPDGEIRS
jgi:hypothetical protein